MGLVIAQPVQGCLEVCLTSFRLQAHLPEASVSAVVHCHCLGNI